jgi:3-hydroxyisobutyrate dehydrogenase
MASPEQVAVLGAGSTMGFPMARNIARAGFTVRAWNRSREKCGPLADDGIRVCDSPVSAVTDAGAIVTMVSDTDAVLEAIGAARPGIARGAIWLQMSTIGERGTGRCIELAAEYGVTFVDAPVLGTRQPAEQGKLVVLASGPDEVRESVQPIFDALGHRTMWLGEAGAGSRFKLAANSWVLTVTEGCAETIALAQGLGVDPRLLLDAFEGGALDLPYFRIKAAAILERKFEPTFSLKLAAKDAALVDDAAKNHDLDLPLMATIRDRLAEGVADHGEEDMAATWYTSAPQGELTRAR